jgi:hypothetical protein
MYHDSQFLDLIKMNFLINLKTGNKTFDMLLIPIIMTLFGIFYKKIYNLCKKKYNNLQWGKYKYKVEYPAIVKKDCGITHLKIPYVVKSILYYINVNNVKNAKEYDITGLNILFQRQSKSKFILNDFDENSLFSINQVDYFIIVKDGEKSIYGKFEKKQTELKKSNNNYNSDNKENTIENENILTIFSNNSLESLKDFSKKCINDYDKYLQYHQDTNIYVFDYLKCENDKFEGSIMQYNKNIFKSNMRFDNIFYESKNDFLRVLNYFIDTKNEKLYKKRGICKKLCILMHGKPGVGKSATIKSIVNHFADIGLKKHIVQVQLNRVKTCSELHDIFFKSNIEDYVIDPVDKIIILEDIDCMSDIVKKRDGNEKKQTNDETKKITLNNVKQMILSVNNDIDNEMISSLGNTSNDTCNKNKNDKITLSYILNLLDGINEISNRVVILTTNHPEKLDPALIRPGRIDYVLELKYSRVVDIKHILENYFETNVDLKDFENIKDFTYSPAFIKQLCNKYSMLEGNDAVSNIIKELL